MSRAREQGTRDAETWLGETPPSQWPDAVRPGVLGADEALINALGVERAARLLGVEPASDADGTTDEALSAFSAYAEAWATRVREAIAEQEEPS